MLELEMTVVVSYNMSSFYTTDGNEVGITIPDEASYHIESANQSYSIVDGTGLIGGGASIIVELENTIPIAMAVLKISNEPELLIPSDEPFADLNGMAFMMYGEISTDWNQNDVWSPMIEMVSTSENGIFSSDVDEGDTYNLNDKLARAIRARLKRIISYQLCCRR